MKNFFKRQREIRLRKWCVEQAKERDSGVNINWANEIYRWVTTGESQFLREPSGKPL